MKNKKLIILGYGGHARSVADVALSCGYVELLFVDSNANKHEFFLDYPVVTNLDLSPTSDWDIFPAAGNNKRRQEQCQQISQWGRTSSILISPTASIGAGSIIRPGCFIGHQAHVGPMADIGLGCIINTAAIVEHECIVGDYSHVSINAAIAGRSVLGSYSMLGAGATIIDSISICDCVNIGAGAVVHKSIDSAGTYVGVPAEKLESFIK